MLRRASRNHVAALGLELPQVGPPVGGVQEGNPVRPPGAFGVVKAGDAVQLEIPAVALGLLQAACHVFTAALGFDHGHRTKAQEQHVVGGTAAGGPLRNRHVAPLGGPCALGVPQLCGVGFPASGTQLLVDPLAGLGLGQLDPGRRDTCRRNHTVQLARVQVTGTLYLPCGKKLGDLLGAASDFVLSFGKPLLEFSRACEGHRLDELAQRKSRVEEGPYVPKSQHPGGVQLGEGFCLVVLQAVVGPVPRLADLVKQPGRVRRDHSFTGQPLQKLQLPLPGNKQQAGAGSDILREEFRELPGLHQGGVGVVQPIFLGQ